MRKATTAACPPESPQTADSLRQACLQAALALNNEITLLLNYAVEADQAIPRDDPRRAALIEIQHAALRASSIVSKLHGATLPRRSR